jgi:hypothetical protein
MLGTLGNPEAVVIVKHEVINATKDLSDADENEQSGFGARQGLTPN